MTRRPDPIDTLIAPGIFFLGFGYFYLFHRLGWFPQDEGVLYYQYLRTHEGQVPYRDFYTGYPPMVYYFHAWVFSRFGISIGVIRTCMAIVNAVSAAGLYAVSRRLTSRAFALLPPALFLVMQPGDITDMGFHNSPYPSWYAVMFAVLGSWTALRFLESRAAGRRALWLLTTGALGALTFLSKQNAGIFFLWGVTGFLASRADPAPTAGESEAPAARILRVGYLAAIPLAALLLVKNFVNPATVALFVLPPAFLARLGARARLGRAASSALPLDLLCVALGFAAAFGPWLLYFARQVGLIAFLRGLFLVGTDVDRNLYIPFPAPGLITVVALLPLAVWALLARTAGGRREAWGRSLWWPSLAFVLGAILSQAPLIGRILRLEFGLGQIHLVASTALDNVAAYLSALVLACAISIAWRQSRGVVRENDPSPDAFLCVLWIAACSFILYYPRMDAAHLICAAPLLYAVAAGLLGRVRATLVQSLAGSRPNAVRRGFHAACALLAAFILLVKTAPKFYSRLMLSRTEAGLRIVPTPKEWLGLDGANIYFPIYLEEQRLAPEAFRELVLYLRENTRPQDPIFAFPALPMVYFLSGRDNGTRQDYFFGNNVSFRQQLDVIRTLDRKRVPTVVMPNDPSEYFVAKGKDYTRVISEYLQNQYYLERRIGPYDVLRRYGTPRSAPGKPANR